MPPTEWRATIRAHLQRSVGGGLGGPLRSLPQDCAGEARARSGDSPRIWTLLVALPRTWVVRLIIWASFAASLSLAAPSSVWAQAGDAAAGKGVYERKCLLCHGEKGDGNGAGAEHLVPRPRDFTKGLYKIRTTANKTPADQDVF